MKPMGCVMAALTLTYTTICVISIYTMITNGFDPWKLTLSIVTGTESLAGFSCLVKADY